MGPPSPERFVAHAMEFDADGDGKLDKDELTKFAEQMHSRMARFGGPGGAGGPGGGRAGGGPPRDPFQEDERPRRPPEE